MTALATEGRAGAELSPAESSHDIGVHRSYRGLDKLNRVWGPIVPVPIARA